MSPRTEQRRSKAPQDQAKHLGNDDAPLVSNLNHDTRKPGTRQQARNACRAVGLPIPVMEQAAKTDFEPDRHHNVCAAATISGTIPSWVTASNTSIPGTPR